MATLPQSQIESANSSARWYDLYGIGSTVMCTRVLYPYCCERRNLPGTHTHDQPASCATGYEWGPVLYGYGYPRSSYLRADTGTRYGYPGTRTGTRKKGTRVLVPSDGHTFNGDVYVM